MPQRPIRPVILTDGASPCNVYWKIGSSATLGTGTAFEGNVLALTTISLGENATVFGRLLARNGEVIRVALVPRRVIVFREGRVVRRFAAIVGKPSTPTPRGRFFVEESLRLRRDESGAPFALATSARSNALQEIRRRSRPDRVARHRQPERGARHRCLPRLRPSRDRGDRLAGEPRRCRRAGQHRPALEVGAAPLGPLSAADLQPALTWRIGLTSPRSSDACPERITTTCPSPMRPSD